MPYLDISRQLVASILWKSLDPPPGARLRHMSTASNNTIRLVFDHPTLEGRVTPTFEIDDDGSRWRWPDGS
jgi:hypothetical protein